MPSGWESPLPRGAVRGRISAAVGLISGASTAKFPLDLYRSTYGTRSCSYAADIVTTNYFGQSFESFKTIAVLVALILTNDELLIEIKDIRTFTGRICKGTESDRSDSVIDFGSNSRVTCYTPPGSTVVIDCLYTTTESTVGRYAVFIGLRPL